MYFATNDVHVPRFPHDRFRGKNPMGLRGDAIAQFDWTVGQLLEALERTGLAENTLIILSSDNGPVVDDGYDDQAEKLLNGHKTKRQPSRRKIQCLRRRNTRTRHRSLAQDHQATGSFGRTYFTNKIGRSSLASLVGACLPKGSVPDSQNRMNTLLGKDKTDRPWVIEQASNHALSVRTKTGNISSPAAECHSCIGGPK